MEKTYEEISSKVDSLLIIDGDELDYEAMRNQKIFSTINRYYVQKSRELESLSNTLAKVEQTRFRHYAGKETALHYKTNPLPEAILKSDIPGHMSVDPIVVEMRGFVKECERIVKYLEESKGSLRSRSFDIRNAIDYRKMMTGG